MLRKSSARLYQVGVHMGKKTKAAELAHQGARMRQWPQQKLPDNFNLTSEQGFKMQALPRDVGVIPRNFLLNVLYQQQPCEVEKLWEMCLEDPTCVLDSRRHLREVLKQCREEGFVYFERDITTNNWICLLTRERFSEAESIAANSAVSNATPNSISVLRGSAVAETQNFAEVFQQMNDEEKMKHLEQLEEAVAATNETVRKYQRTEVEYLPYTDLNGKVNFMWWYDVRDAATEYKASSALGSGGPSALPEPLPKVEGI